MKKNIKMYLCMLIVFIVLTILSSIFAYSSLTNFAPKYGILTENTNFRSKATTKEKAIKVLKKGTSIKMVGKIDDFYIVELGSSEIGTVYSKYVKSSTTSPKGAKVYTTLPKKPGIISGSNVNFRRGPSTKYTSISKLSKGTNVSVIGYIDNWYSCVLSNGTVGMVSTDLVGLSGTTSKPQVTTPSAPSTPSTIPAKGDTNEEIILKLINEARKKSGLNALVMDDSLLKVARLKSQDMVTKGYFSHSSPTYGTPFEMMKKYSISYKVAGENIAGNPSLENAVNSWLNSNTHKENILSTSYNLVGIGVSKSDVYGYIIVAMFVGR